MHKIIEWVKAHPYESGALALVIAVAVYLILRSESSQSSASSSGDNAASDYYAAQAQVAQANAASTAQDNQLQAQLDAAQLSANTQTNEVNAQLAATQDQDAAQIQALQIQTAGQTAQTQLEADVATDQITAQQSVANTQTAAQISVANIQAQTEDTAANLSAQTQDTAIGAQVQAQQIQADTENASTQAQVQENHDNLATVLGLVTSQNQVQESEAQDELDAQGLADSTATTLSGQEYNYYENQDNDSMTLETNALADSTSLEENQATNINNIVTQLIPQFGTGTDDYTQGLESTIESLEGQPNAAAAEDSLEASQSQSSAVQSVGIANAVGNTLTGIASGLFA